MTVKLTPVTENERQTLWRLLQLYEHDHSEFIGTQISDDATYEYTYFDSYFTDDDRFAFLIYSGEQLAGFVMINSYQYLTENKDGRSIAEFFVLRSHRRKSVGQQAALAILERFRGRWEIREHANNVGAIAFWRSLIDDYTKGDFVETIPDHNIWPVPVQSFDNSSKKG